MTRTEMEPALREQLLETVLGELGRKGREGIDLGAAMTLVGISEEEFAAEYTDLDGCLDAGFERLSVRLDRAVRLGCRTAGPPGDVPGWPTRVRGGLEALLAELAVEPTLTLALTRIYPSLGTEQQARYQAFVESFGPLLADGRAASLSSEELPDEVEMLAVGAAETIIFEEIAAGRAAELGAMGPSILFTVLVPFLGPAGATAEMEKAQH